MLQSGRNIQPTICRHFQRGSACLAVLLFCALIALPTSVTAYDVHTLSDFESIYNPGIPPSVSVEWSFPTGFSLGINSGYKLRIGGDSQDSRGSSGKMSTIPLSFSMKYNLYKTQKISQSIGVGLGPYFLHEGEMPIRLEDVEVTGRSTCNTEWISHLSRNIYLNLKMKYAYAFESVVNQIPLWDFTTWLGVNLRW